MSGSTRPLVSVLVPAYNHGQFVQRCLDSVLGDRYPAKELVVIDDGSSDDTGEKIADWIARHGDELPVTFLRRRNLGVAATLNELSSLARGEFLRIGASDDYLLPGGTEALVCYLLKHPRKNAVVGDAIVVDRDGERLHASAMCDLHRADKRLYTTDEGIRRAVIAHWAIGGPVAMLRRGALGKIGGWTEQLRIDDWDFFLRLVAQDALGFIDIPVCAYRLHGANLSKTRHVATRIANLAESQRVARHRMALFEGADQVLLKAQCHYIGAKIAFLQRNPFRVGLNVLAWLALKLASRWRFAPPQAVVEKA